MSSRRNHRRPCMDVLGMRSCRAQRRMVLGEKPARRAASRALRYSLPGPPLGIYQPSQEALAAARRPRPAGGISLPPACPRFMPVPR
jgi:hypothetical protein